MNLSRRGFVVGNGLALGLTLAPGRLLAALDSKAAAPTPSSWEGVRKLFNLSPEWLHFAGFFIASHPTPVRDAIEAYRKALDANPFATVEENFRRDTENLQVRVRQELATYFGCGPDELALTANTTTGLVITYNGLPLRAGDEVLTTTHDHYVHHTAISLACKRNGAAVRKISLYDDPTKVSVAGIVERVRAGVRPETRVLGITWVSSQTGVRLPVRQIAAAVAEINAKRAEHQRVVLVVDGVHGLGAVDDTVADLGADVFCAGTHKWMFGPRGTGVVWARPAVWARMTPTVPSFGDPESFLSWAENREPKTPGDGWRMSPGGFVAYEHQWGVAAAFKLHRDIGRAKIGARVAELNGQLKDGLAKIPGVKLLTPRDPTLSAGINTFEMAGRSTDEVVSALHARKVVASGSPYRPSYPRLSASIFNSPDEVKKALDAVQSLASA